LGDLGLDGDSIKIHLEIRYKDANWIHLAQEMDHWRALVNTAMNLHPPQG
jgi:hypothetical protein